MIRREDESKHRRKETGSSRGGDSRQVIIYDCNDVCDEDWEEHNHKENKESDLRESNGVSKRLPGWFVALDFRPKKCPIWRALRLARLLCGTFFQFFSGFVKCGLP